MPVCERTKPVRVEKSELGMSETMPITCIEEYASKPELLEVTSLASMIVNSKTTNFGLEPLILSILWYHMVYGKVFIILIILIMMYGDLR